MPKKPVYKRILLKLSGEALMGGSQQSIDPGVLDRIVKEVSEVRALGVQVAIVIGGGNFCRGAVLSKIGIDRITADYIGMLATVMNSLALRDSFEHAGIETRVHSAIPMSGIVEHFDRREAIHNLAENRVVIFAAGTGNPLVTTDTTASLRGIEVQADVILKATNVDGVYDKDPSRYPNAVRYQHLTYKQALDQELGVMDLSAFCQCRDYNMKLRVFNIHKPGALLRVVLGEDEGTLLTN